jgi:hypothetical protein
MKNPWFKPQLSFDGVLLLAYTVGTVWFVANMNFKLDSNGHNIRSIARTQLGVLHSLQQIKETMQSKDPTNHLEITVPDAPNYFDFDNPDGHITAMSYPAGKTKGN